MGSSPSISAASVAVLVVTTIATADLLLEIRKTVTSCTVQASHTGANIDSFLLVHVAVIEVAAEAAQALELATTMGVGLVSGAGTARVESAARSTRSTECPRGSRSSEGLAIVAGAGISTTWCSVA